MKKIVIAIDAFKGCLTSLEAGQAAAEGVRLVYPGCEICCLPVADGGEGVSDVLVAAFNGRFRTLQALGFRFLDTAGRELGTGGRILAEVDKDGSGRVDSASNSERPYSRCPAV